ncbi:MAG: chaperone NapD [Deferribacteres bacterium]|nr:chaperone NapD [candidate division KSB1 bacterium]MCB9500398.1 chaperone NapD [Deferribacteres bacterium]
MFISSIIVKVNPGTAKEIEKEIKKMGALTSYGIHKDENIIIVAETEKLYEVKAICSQLMHNYKDVTGVFPTYLTSDNDELEEHMLEEEMEAH